ncbi:hypothetical protein [Desulfosarcina ovata]|uniref:Uncharacterized protein n=1 Tax=Desulfosarcina ovata subsp. ovata TaxID=2752305 RepID=A0A5K8AGZ7_9BACT|nr:hypothetical protein [Desulfosarcina ovata]BBO91779.1 hypothetical protein DSCOOX_49590 [Desulfosarcina ovata subsp. ovata]
MTTLSTTVVRDVRFDDRLPWVSDAWLDFNHQLNRDAAGLPNEAILEKRLAGVERLTIDDPCVYWLTLARIAEMALKQAGDYADQCEFQAAGDLLINPRRVEVYRRGWKTAVVKRRHMALSEQFAAAIGDELPAAWLTRETLTQVCQEALLPHLEKRLSASGVMADTYLNSLTLRMQRVSGTIAFLNAWQIADSLELYGRVTTASRADRDALTAELCRFDYDVFDALGQDIENRVVNPDADSAFLEMTPAVDVP